MARLLSIVKVIYYKIKYNKLLRWDKALRCSKVSDIKIVQGFLEIGENLAMNPGSYIAVVNDGTMKIGNDVSLNRNTLIICHDMIAIGNHCSIGPNVLIYDHDHKFGMNGLETGYNTSPVMIGDNCWIGGGVTILRGTHIGEGCIIGAGCVVKGEVPPHSLVTANRELNVLPIENRSR